jgi:hypothetical protein
MLAKAIFAVAAAVLAGLAAFAPPEAAAGAGRSAMAGTSIAPIRIEAPRRIRNKALELALQCKLDAHQNASRYCGTW